MQPLPDRYALFGRYVFSPGALPRERCWVCIADGRIESIVDEAPAGPRFETDNVAILPGLINAHAHLEFSDCQEPLGEPGIAMADWIKEVIVYRKEDARPSYATRAGAGIAESIRSGSVAVADILTCDALPETPPHIEYLALRELIATDEQAAEREMAMARSFLDRAVCDPVRLGISPHAPYSVHAQLWKSALASAAERRIPLAIHLAESEAELEFLESHSGPFGEFLRDQLGIADDFIGAARRPLELLKQLAAVGRALVIHGNYLTAEEIRFLATLRKTCTLIYCPRTHAYFGHVPYPLESILDANVSLALGTDGRGSNPDLSIFAEMQFVAERYPKIPGDSVLAMGTLAGAAAIGLSDRLGSIEPGKDASLAVVRLSEKGANPYRLLFDGKSEVVATLFRGALVACQGHLFGST
ncbi:MAG: amidohydrolase family protein [Pirellulales bacterium]|jgi:cytosine/adenosine deaminase-related metal-dependent hydrolase|nr:amidohydrolase family protein [Pirellulales bacterium]